MAVLSAEAGLRMAFLRQAGNPKYSSDRQTNVSDGPEGEKPDSLSHNRALSHRVVEESGENS